MNNTMTLPIKKELQKMVDSKEDAMPMTLAHVLTPLELGKIWVIHPTDFDPVLVSSIFWSCCNLADLLRSAIQTANHI